MLPYYIAYGLMVAVGACTVGRKAYNRTKARKQFFVFFSVLWIVLLGFRHPSMGIDLRYGTYYGYLGRFEYIGGLTWREVFQTNVMHFEQGYKVVNKLLSLLGTDYTILLVACAILSLVPIAVWLYRNSDYPVLSAVIYLALPAFALLYSGLRQSIAIAITTISIEMIKQKKPWRFLLVILFATLFHAKAWVFLPAYPAYHIRLNKKSALVSAAIPILVYLFRYPLFRLLVKVFQMNTSIGDNGAFTLFIVFWTVYIFSVVFGHEDDKEEQGLRNLFLIAVIVQAFSPIHNTVIRVGYHYMVVLAVLLPRIIRNTMCSNQKRFSGQKSATFFYLLIFVCFMTFGLYTLDNGANTWVMSSPYRFFWQ